MSAIIPVPAGSIAVVVTHLEMKASPATGPVKPPLPGLSLWRVEQPSVDWYLPLYRRIGEDFLWFSRLTMTDAQLRQAISAPTTAIYAVRDRDRDIGLVELDWRHAPDCKILFFGLVPDTISRGIGSWMMTETQRLAFDGGARRLWLHTCTADHPRALPFYLAHGFRAFKREIEIAPDPRLYADVPSDAAASLPIIAPPETAADTAASDSDP